MKTIDMSKMDLYNFALKVNASAAEFPEGVLLYTGLEIARRAPSKNGGEYDCLM